jgi:4-hydroxymandelate oxidase
MASRSLTRRDLLGQIGTAFARQGATMRGRAGQGRDAGSGDPAPAGLVPRGDLVNTLEFEEQAKKRLPVPVFSAIAGSQRAPLDRVTLHPRMCVPVLDMDLSVRLYGDSHFAPIVVAPIENQRRFHAEGELATVKGATAAKTALIVSDRSSVPLAELVSQARAPLWFQVFANDPAAGTKAQSAIQSGCRAVCVTLSSRHSARGQTPGSLESEWTAVASLARTSTAPVIVKGIATRVAAEQAISRGAQGLVVSAYNTATGGHGDSPVLQLAEIVEAARNVPVFVDGSFRRGTDIIKALAFGARAVLIGRPVMWGLAAYGADGVQGLLEMLQTELARYMGMCGRVRVADLDRTLVRTHANG